MIVFYKHLLPLLDRRTKKMTCFAVLVMMCLALLEALALIMLVPLMQLLTSSNLSSNSQAVTAAGDLFGTSSSSDLALLLGVLVLCTYVVKSVAAVFASRWVTTLALEQEALTVKQLMHVYLPRALPAAPRAQQRRDGEDDHELVREDLPGGVRLDADGARRLLLDDPDRRHPRPHQPVARDRRRRVLRPPDPRLPADRAPSAQQGDEAPPRRSKRRSTGRSASRSPR